MVLVTGATGILGRVLVLELLKSGKKVRAAKRPSSNLQEVRDSFSNYIDEPSFFFKQIEWVDIDLNDCQSIAAALKGIDEVYHCAAKVSYDPADRREIIQVNVTGTINIVNCCKSSDVRKFLYVGSAAIFDIRKNAGTIREKSKVISGKRNTLYAISKKLAENAVLSATSNKLKTVIVHPGLIIGSGSGNNKSGGFLKILAENNYTFSGGTGCVDVRDVAKIAVLLMAKELSGERFILSSENCTYKKLSEMIKIKMNARKAFLIPKVVLNAGRILNFLTGGILPGLRLLSRPNIEFLSTYQKISGSKLAKLLNYNFIPVQNSVDFHIGNMIESKRRKKADNNQVLLI